MEIQLERVTDKAILRAGGIFAVDPKTRKSVQVWGQDRASPGGQGGLPAREANVMEVLLPTAEFDRLKERVRTVKEATSG